MRDEKVQRLLSQEKGTEWSHNLAWEKYKMFVFFTVLSGLKKKKFPYSLSEIGAQIHPT